MEEDGWQVFEQRIVDEKNDGHFYGMTTVKKVVVTAKCVREGTTPEIIHEEK